MKLFWNKNIILLFSALFILVIVSACGDSASSTDGEESNSSGDTSSSDGDDGNDLGDTDAITFVAWGGTTQDAQEEAWGIPFTTETGITVNSDNTDYGKFKAMVESGNVIWMLLMWKLTLLIKQLKKDY